MIKTILVHLNGSRRDTSVLGTALNVARPFAAHLECVHVRPSRARLIMLAAQNVLGSEDASIADIVAALEKEAAEKTGAARKSYDAFCREQNIASVEAPPPPPSVSAAWREEHGDETKTLISQIRLNDFAVLAGGADGNDGLAAHELAQVLTAGGRPLLLAPAEPPKRPLKTVAVAWKDSPESARAVSAALPLLKKAERVVVIAAGENPDAAADASPSAECVVRHLRWHGAKAEARDIELRGREVPEALLHAARKEDTDILVMGGYGRGRLTELVFGGFTRHVLGGIDIPVFMLH